MRRKIESQHIPTGLLITIHPSKFIHKRNNTLSRLASFIIMPRRGTKRKRDEQHTDEYIDEHGSKRYKQLCSGLTLDHVWFRHASDSYYALEHFMETKLKKVHQDCMTRKIIWQRKHWKKEFIKIHSNLVKQLWRNVSAKYAVKKVRHLRTMQVQ